MIGDSTVAASSTCGIFELLCGLGSGRYQWVRNAGVTGNTTTQMAARFGADVAAYRPGFVCIMGAVNNIGAAVSVAQAVADYTSMISATLSWGGTPIIFAACPYNTSPAGLQAYNNAFNKLAQTFGVQYVDPWKTCVDVTNGHWIDANYSADGTHPTPKAARIAAAYALTQLTLPTFYPNLPQNNADTTGKISNCLFVTNTVPGTPDGWTIDAAFTPSLTAGTSDVLGNWFNLTFSGLAAYKSCTGPFSFSGISAGDTVQLVGRMKTSGFEANGLGPNPGQGKVDAQLFVQFSGGSAPALPLSPSIGADLSGGIFSETLVIPAGTVGATLTILIGPRSGNVSGVFSIAQLQCFDQTKMV